jgi:hypothetical protein
MIFGTDIVCASQCGHRHKSVAVTRDDTWREVLTAMLASISRVPQSILWQYISKKETFIYRESDARETRTGLNKQTSEETGHTVGLRRRQARCDVSVTCHISTCSSVVKETANVAVDVCFLFGRSRVQALFRHLKSATCFYLPTYFAQYPRAVRR